MRLQLVGLRRLRPNALTLTAMAAFSVAGPAEASTMPPIARDGGIVWSVGLPTASLDMFVSPVVSLGATALVAPPFGTSVAARAMWRCLGATDDISLAAVVSAGHTRSSFLRTFDETWLQPALLLNLPLGRASRVSLRVMAGPVLGSHHEPAQRSMFGVEQREATTPSWYPVVPNAELAFQMGPGQELLIGAYPVVAWRAQL